MKYFSLFSGIGGFEYGIEKALLGKTVSSMELQRETKSGESARQSLLPNNLCPNTTPKWLRESKCVGFSEIDRYATQIYKKHFPSHKEYGNVTNIKCTDVPDFDLLCGGFPCQSFSIAGKRGGFDDTRGTLFFEIARVAQEKQPRLLLLENVKGLLSHDKGRTFGTILNTLDELGYDLQWQVLNSKNFGVPQNRERVFIIGHLRTTPRPQVFPLLRSDSNIIQRNKETAKQFASTITSKYGTGNARGTHLRITKKGIKKKNQEIVGCLSGGAHSGGNHSDMDLYADDMRIRRLTPTECERLQGFEDNWTEKGIDLKGNEILISDTQRYKCLGNAVSCPVITAIAERLLL